MSRAQDAINFVREDLDLERRLLLGLDFERHHPLGVMAVAREVEELLRGMTDNVERYHARQLIRRRLAHPEVVGLSGGPPHLESEATIHPKAGSRLAAHEGGPICAQCGWPRRSHDIDGERLDCDGYVEVL